MMSWAARFQLRQHVRQSLWAVPLVGTLVGGALAAVDLALEARVTLPGGWTYSASTAGNLLSAVAGAMIGLLGLVVTIGVLVVQMATGTLSPRFMRLWYRDRLQKIVLGSFTATFAFAFVLLQEIGTGEVPNLGVAIAGLAVVGDLILLLLYLDRFVHALRPVAVAAAMAHAGLKVVDGLGLAAPRIRDGEQAVRSTQILQVRSRSSGAIQAINNRQLVEYAEAHDTVVVLHYAVGDFVYRGDVLLDVHGQPPPDAARRLLGMVALGHERTLEQDPAFAVRIIVDIAIRALSPAVNDPTTATQMINHLGALLAGLGAHDLGERGLLADSSGTLRLAVPTRTWEGYLELGISEIREYGVGSPQTCRRLQAMLRDLEGSIRPTNQAAVRRQLELLERSVRQRVRAGHDLELALTADRQGLGGSSLELEGTTLAPRRGK